MSKAWGGLRGLANARPPGSAKFTKAHTCKHEISDRKIVNCSPYFTSLQNMIILKLKGDHIKRQC